MRLSRQVVTFLIISYASLWSGIEAFKSTWLEAVGTIMAQQDSLFYSWKSLCILLKKMAGISHMKSVCQIWYSGAKASRINQMKRQCNQILSPLEIVQAFLWIGVIAVLGLYSMVKIETQDTCAPSGLGLLVRCGLLMRWDIRGLGLYLSRTMPRCTLTVHKPFTNPIGNSLDSWFAQMTMSRLLIGVIRKYYNWTGLADVQL